jgi:P-type Cu2+ transporter
VSAEAVTERALLRAMAVAGFAAGNIMLLSVAVWAGQFQDMGPATRGLLHWFSTLIGCRQFCTPAGPSSIPRSARCATGAPTWMCRSRSVSCWQAA